ncbi:MAG TPA: hypothetical protein VHL58_12335 [Thermoanaerobaculia bacterium]|nr:hypothetical protein [Thermoanaerobaculia bacterium]
MIRKFLSVAGLVALCAFPVHADDAQSIATRSMDFMAGNEWSKVHYIAFTFNVVRGGNIAVSYPQRFNPVTGDYRVSGKDKEGHEFVVVMNVYSREGKAWVDGKPPADAKPWLDKGYGRFINDTYWLLMPHKLLDPGVHLESAGEKTDQGHVYDVLKLSFDGVGLTPGDQYWVWIDRDTHLIRYWEMLLQDMKRDETPERWVFHDFERKGGLLLSTRKTTADGATEIRLSDVDVRQDVPAGAFSK